MEQVVALCVCVCVCVWGGGGGGDYTKIYIFLKKVTKIMAFSNPKYHLIKKKINNSG